MTVTLKVIVIPGNKMAVVKLYANLRKLAGTKELSTTGETVSAVVSELVRLKPPVGEIVLENGRLAPHVIVTLNGHNITDFETPVVEQDIIAIFPPMAGG
jgi:MoaD family protein